MITKGERYTYSEEEYEKFSERYWRLQDKVNLYLKTSDFLFKMLIATDSICTMEYKGKMNGTRESVFSNTNLYII